MITLRDYQQECVNLINGLDGGRVLVSMATGLGKTVVFSRIKRRGRVLIISHREELVHQPIKFYDCPCGIEQGNVVSHGEEVVSASVQSLVRRLDKFKKDEFDLIITDEAHHAAAPSYKKIYEYFTPRLHVGFTATPNRGDKVRLDDVFDQIIFQRDLKWGIQNFYLTDIMCLRVTTSYDVSNVKQRMGDFVVGELDKAVNNQKSNKEIADVYKKYAKGQTLIFTASVDHAENVAKEIPGAVVVSQKTKDRAQIIADFTARKIPCIVNCMIFTEGTDIPLIETIIIARPTKNASLYTQMVGRGLRKFEGKKFLTLIDCVGVTDNNDICTAPSLMGLDLNKVPKYKLPNVEGMLTDMQCIIDDVSECPVSWVLNAKAVELFGREQGVNMHNLNWALKPNGDLVYQFRCGDRIGIKAVNELGKTVVMRYYFEEKLNKFTYEQSEFMPLANALEVAFGVFCANYQDEKLFWDNTQNLDWRYQPATEKQVKLIQDSVSARDYEELMVRGALSKSDANQVINMLYITGLKKHDLMRLRKKSILEKQAMEQDRQARAMLKIRQCYDDKLPKRKFYAIKHATDLVITNSWEVCNDTYLALNGVDGKKAYFKCFYSQKDAEEFLRK